MDIDRYKMGWEEARTRLEALNIDLPEQKVYGVPRGGAVVAAMLRVATPVLTLKEADVVLDDIIDSGETRLNLLQFMVQHGLPTKPIVALVDKVNREDDRQLGWIVFPWEREDEQSSAVLHHVGTDARQVQGRRTIIQKQTQQLRDCHVRVTCPCGRSLCVTKMHRCPDCGIWFCPTCAAKHFRRS